MVEISEEDRELLEQSGRRFQEEGVKRARQHEIFVKAYDHLRNLQLDLAWKYFDKNDPYTTNATRENIMSGTAYCNESPIDFCVYNDVDDPCHDQCLFCGQPAERK